MDQDMRDEPRASNDSRSKAPAETGKEAPVEKKQSIASDMAALFETLMPLYAAVASANAQ
jgi:hypothetical protein